MYLNTRNSRKLWNKWTNYSS